MLVLTRKLDEQIRIGQDVTITIVKLRGNTVRIGIEAPRGVDVRRGELPPKESGSLGWPNRSSRPDGATETGRPEPAGDRRAALSLSVNRARARIRRPR
jgi:carbon storage regulator CsrA